MGLASRMKTYHRCGQMDSQTTTEIEKQLLSVALSWVSFQSSNIVRVGRKKYSKSNTSISDSLDVRARRPQFESTIVEYYHTVL